MWYWTGHPWLRWRYNGLSSIQCCSITAWTNADLFKWCTKKQISMGPSFESVLCKIWIAFVLTSIYCNFLQSCRVVFTPLGPTTNVVARLNYNESGTREHCYHTSHSLSAVISKMLSHTPLCISICQECVANVCETHMLKVKWKKRTG